MSIQFLTADPHFGHGNICLYCKRPWLRKEDLSTDGLTFISPEAALACAERMDAGLIHNCNERVKPDDRVLCVGDFLNRGRAKGVMGLRTKYSDYLKALNGSWTLLRGNHDDQNKVKTTGDHMIGHWSHFKVFVSHYPTESVTHDPALMDYVHAYCDFTICGHVHEAWKIKLIECGRKPLLNINVGLDQWNYRPVTIDEVVKYYIKEKKERGL